MNHLPKKKLEVYANRLRQLEERTHCLTPKQILDDAKSEKSPTHDYFEWDDSVAGKGYRLNQARELIRTVKVNISLVGGGSMTIREYYSVVESNDEEANLNQRTYVSVRRVEAEPALREQVIAQALVEVNRWKEKYDQYTELRSITDAIRKTSTQLNKIDLRGLKA